MSLLDTIKGAREEAEAGRKAADTSKDQESVEEEAYAKRGNVRRSAARAKPKRKAAAGVRVEKAGSKNKKDKKNMTKEERKAERKAERELEDRRYTLSQAYINEDEEYKRARKTWWIFLGVGMVLVVVAFTLYGFVNQDRENASPVLAFVSAASMVLAYAAIIGGLIYDWVKIRPLRKRIDARIGGMSDKRVKQALDKKAKEQAEQEAREKAEKNRMRK